MGMLGRLAKARPETVFGFSAAWRRRAAQNCCKLVPHVDLVVGTQKFHRVADYVDELVERKRADRRMDDPRFSIVDTEEEAVRRRPFATHARERDRRPRLFPSCRAATCIAPFASCRGRAARNAVATIEEIVSEVRELVERGVKEVTLLGQIVNLYGRHEFPTANRTAKSPFVQLLEAVHAIEGLERLRFTSPHPIGFRDDLDRALCATCRNSASTCILPLQSGSDRILKAMHRPYTAENICAWSIKFGRARRNCPHHRCDRRLSRRDRGRTTKRRALWWSESNSITLSSFATRTRRDTPAARWPDKSTSR